MSGKLSIKDAGCRSIYSDYSKKIRKDKMAKKKAKKRRKKRKTFPPRIKTGPRKGQFRKRKKRKKTK
ncbi:unnamed protein product [marine sediment metagenome]|uniref:Uncharacterized protein n=1 Tax=marine sediment metagenome TaxID=412755 RepID=X1HIZ5_9ZZZZ